MCMHQIEILEIFVPDLREIYLFGTKIDDGIAVFTHGRFSWNLEVFLMNSIIDVLSIVLLHTFTCQLYLTFLYKFVIYK